LQHYSQSDKLKLGHSRVFETPAGKLTRISADNGVCFRPTDIARKQSSLSEMQTESQAIDQTSKVSQPPRLEKPVRITEQLWPGGAVPVVSIFCITYNHEKFIRDAIEGFLMQETTFPVEIFVHDDASADGTADIVREYQANYPRLFRTVFQIENQYLKDGFRFFFEHLGQRRGEFIALCEGDDCWTSPQKLQKQVELLERSPEYSLVSHKVRIKWESASGRDLVSNSGDEAGQWKVRDIIHGKTVHTCSMLYRRAFVPAMPSSFANLAAGDIPLQLLLADAGPIDFVPEVWGLYRKHSGGVTHEGRRETPRNAKTLEDIYVNFDRHCGGRYRREISSALSSVYALTAVHSRRQGDYFISVLMTVKAMRWSLSSGSTQTVWRTILLCLVPTGGQQRLLKGVGYLNRIFGRSL
jgi:glycosyltransferase involved in cell wall biosynthesis